MKSNIRVFVESLLNELKEYEEFVEDHLNNLTEDYVDKLLLEVDTNTDREILKIARKVYEDFQKQLFNLQNNKFSMIQPKDDYYLYITPFDFLPPIRFQNEIFTIARNAPSSYLPKENIIEINSLDFSTNDFGKTMKQYIDSGKLKNVLMHEITHYFDTQRQKTNKKFMQNIKNPKKELELSAIIKQILADMDSSIIGIFRRQILNNSDTKISSDDLRILINQYINYLMYTKANGHTTEKALLQGLSKEQKKKVYKELYLFFFNEFNSLYPSLKIQNDIKPRL